MMQQGIQSLMPGQASQAPMPGMMPQQGAPTPAAEIARYNGLQLPQLIALFQRQPSGVLLGKITKELEAQKLRSQQAGQQAMAAAAQQRGTVKDDVMAEVAQTPVMAAQGGIMQGYAGGGAVAFSPGGSTTYEPFRQKIAEYQDAIKQLRAAAQSGDSASAARYAQVVQTLRQQLEPKLTEVARYKSSEAEAPAQVAKIFEQGIPTAARAVAPTPSTPDLMGESLAPAAPSPKPSPAPVAPPSSKTGIAQPRSRPQGATPVEALQGLGSFVEQTGTPPPDRLSQLESSNIAGIRALQDAIRQQGTVDPELAKLREAAYKSSQDIAARRERDRQAMLESGQKQYDDITDLLIGAAGGAKGKTSGEVLSGAVGGAGAARTAKRAEFQKVKEASRQEQNAIDNLNQALADKRVADLSGDVDKRREAARRVAEAELKVVEFGMTAEKERAAEADRVEKNRLTAQGQLLQQQTAREQMANLMALERMRQNAPKPDQDQIKRAEDLKLNELTGGKPGDATTAQRIQAMEYALNTVKGAGRAESIEAGNRRAAMDLLKDWQKETGSKIQMRNPKNPQAYEDAKKEEIERIKRVLGVDLSVSPAGAATTTKSGATVSNWN